MMLLGTRARGRANNLNLIRAIAATAVLVSHAWPIALGRETPEPFSKLLGHSLGTMAVYVFFGISGYLIAASYARNPDPWAFLAARGLRLFPGLCVSLLLVAFVMAPLVAAFSPGVGPTMGNLVGFFLRNLTLLSPQYSLPGVFDTNPYPAVEGSIWTLVHETACYLGVLAVGLTGAFSRSPRLWLALALYGLLWLSFPLWGQGLHPKLDAFQRLSFPFAVGVLFYALRDRLPLNLWLASLLLGLWYLLADTVAAEPAMALALCYVTFWLAYVPRGRILAYNRLGDYSYGIYVYAFPLQGLVVWLLGPMTPVENIVITLPITLVCAILSWHLVEAPALELRHKFHAVIR